MNRYAILDMSNLAYRAFHMIPHEFWVSDQTTLAKSIAKTCAKFEEGLAVETLVFCFDGGSHFRSTVWPAYKKSRKDERETESEIKKNARAAFFEQLAQFRKFVLPLGGAKNVFYQEGFEADDLIASCVQSLPDAKKIYIVSSDEDLFQLLEGNRVVMYRPHKKDIYNEEAYRAAHLNLSPCMHASVKAWAGCSSDNIEGIKGIGDVKACRFLNGESGSRDTFYDNIHVYNRNIVLTRLPAPETPKYTIVPQDPPIDWNRILDTNSTAAPTSRIKKR